MEDAQDAIENAKEQKLKTNIVRTLTSRRNALNTSFEAWSKACGDYSLKSSATMTTVEKNTDITDNVRPVRKQYLDINDELSDLIEDKLAIENTKLQDNKVAELQQKIKMKCKEIDVKIQCHKTRSCPAEMSKNGKDRMYKELDRDVIQPMDDVKQLYLELLAALADEQKQIDITNQEEVWMDTNNKLVMEISDKLAAVPEVTTGLDNLDNSTASSHSSARASLRVKKADPPKFDGKIPSFPRFKKSDARL